MSSNCEKFSARLGSPSGPFTGTRLSPIQEDKKNKNENREIDSNFLIIIPYFRNITLFFNNYY